VKLWTWSGDEWRQVSPNEAAYRRDCGAAVVEADESPSPNMVAFNVAPDDVVEVTTPAQVEARRTNPKKPAKTGG
jgi:hypothetical protein